MSISNEEEHVASKDNTENWSSKFTFYLAATYVFIILGFLTSGFMLLGVLENKHKFILPWILTFAMVIIGFGNQFIELSISIITSGQFVYDLHLRDFAVIPEMALASIFGQQKKTTSIFFQFDILAFLGSKIVQVLFKQMIAIVL